MKLDVKNMRKIGARISHVRRLRQLTQAKLAELAGVSTTYISKIERGESEPKLAVVFKIASALQTSPSDLLIDARFGPDREQIKKQALSLLRQVRSLIDEL